MPGVKWLERSVNTVADPGHELSGLREDGARDTLAGLCRCLISGRGHASSIALAGEH